MAQMDILDCNLRTLIKGKRLTVKTIDHFRENDVFIVSDETAYGVPAKFIVNGRASTLPVGATISALYVGAELCLKHQGAKVRHLKLEDPRLENRPMIVMARPRCLLVKRPKAQTMPSSDAQVLLLQNINTSSFANIKFLIREQRNHTLTQGDVDYIQKRLSACNLKEVNFLRKWDSRCSISTAKDCMPAYPRRLAPVCDKVDQIMQHAEQEFQARKRRTHKSGSFDATAELPWYLPGGKMDAVEPAEGHDHLLDESTSLRLASWQYCAEKELQEEIGMSLERNKERLEDCKFRVVGCVTKQSGSFINPFLLAFVEDDECVNGLFEPNREYARHQWLPVSQAYKACTACVAGSGADVETPSRCKAGSEFSAIGKEDWLAIFQDPSHWEFYEGCRGEDEEWWSNVIFARSCRGGQTDGVQRAA